jgi:hypothetical protein
MIREGDAWFSLQGAATANQLEEVTGPPAGAVTAQAPVVSTGAQYGAVYVTGPLTVKAGEKTTSRVRVTNTGTAVWREAGKFHLSYHWHRDGKLIDFDGVRTFLPFGEIAPGQSVLIEASVKVPSASGTYTLKWDMVQEDVTWFSWKGVPTGDQIVTVK